MAVWLWLGNKAAVFTMEDAILSATEKSAHIYIYIYTHTHTYIYIYISPPLEELCIRSLFHLVGLSMGSFTARFWDYRGKMWGANALRHGRKETGCCTMTMRLHTPRSLWGNSWQKITWPLFPTLPSHLTWPPVISTCSLKWNCGWKGGISYPLKRSKHNRNRY